MSVPFTSLISATDLARQVSPAWCIFDCRFNLGDPGYGRKAYASGHIPGALFLDLETDLSGLLTGRNGRHPLPEPERLADKLGSLGVDDRRQVVAYDDVGGMFAARLWWLLRWLGHDHVAVLNGGLQAWLSSGLPLSTETSEPRATTFVHRPQDNMKVDADYVLNHLNKPGMLLVDARAPDRYRGENETLDPVGGHIPGAVNRFFKDNLGPDGCFKQASELQEDFGQILKGGNANIAVLQCGSGVTACHNLLAMEVAGLDGARLYAGSWSEWCADPTRPVATGPG